jgi:hypothetical protein
MGGASCLASYSPRNSPASDSKRVIPPQSEDEDRDASIDRTAMPVVAFPSLYNPTRTYFPWMAFSILRQANQR